MTSCFCYAAVHEMLKSLSSAVIHQWTSLKQAVEDDRRDTVLSPSSSVTYTQSLQHTLQEVCRVICSFSCLVLFSSSSRYPLTRCANVISNKYQSYYGPGRRLLHYNAYGKPRLPPVHKYSSLRSSAHRAGGLLRWTLGYTQCGGSDGSMSSFKSLT